VVEEGQEAPDFDLLSDEGERVSLSDFRGRPVVLYFYSRDDTPGCTAQACGIRDTYDDFRKAGAVVLGVSADTQASHVRFKEKYGLPFTLLADPDRSAGEAYDVVDDDGRSFERTTFLIDPDGKVARVLRHVDPTSHAGDVLAALA
jgi:peroxiredoxin Q/BCP